MLLIQLITIHIIFFLAVVYVMRKIMIKSSYDETKRLQQLNQENTMKAHELAEKIAEAEKEYRKKITVAEDEIRRMKAQAKEEIDHMKEEMLVNMKQEKERIIKQTLNTKEKIREEIEEQMQDKSVELACRIIQEILSSKNQRLVHEGFMDEVLEDLEKIEEDVLHVPPNKGPLEIRTPHKLDSDYKEKIEKILTFKIGRKINLEEVVDKEVIAGVVIKLGSLVINGSLAEKFNQAVKAVKNKG